MRNDAMDSALEKLSETVRDAGRSKRALRVRGGGTKDFYGQALEGEVLDTRGHNGIVTYEPSELVITARCGAKLSEIEATMRGRGGALGAAPPGGGRAARFRARRKDHGWARRNARLRRAGDEERRRLRRLAPDGGVARHASDRPGSLAQGAAAAGRRGDAQARASGRQGDRHAQQMRRKAPADQRERLERRRARRTHLRRGSRGEGRSGKNRRPASRRRASRALLDGHPRTDRSVLPE